MIAGNLSRAAAPGNLLIRSHESGLPEDSVINVSQILTADKAFLRDKTGQLSAESMRAVENGVALVMNLKLAS